MADLAWHRSRFFQACTSSGNATVWHCLALEAYRSVTVGVWLERAFNGYADVVGLLLGQLGDHAAETADHFQGHFFVELLGQHFDRQALGFLLGRQVGVLLLEQEDLCQDLVGEGAIHDAAWVASGIAQVSISLSK